MDARNRKSACVRSQSFRKLVNARVPKIEKISPRSEATFVFNPVIHLGCGSHEAVYKGRIHRTNPLNASNSRGNFVLRIYIYICRRSRNFFDRIFFRNKESSRTGRKMTVDPGKAINRIAS